MRSSASVPVSRLLALLPLATMVACSSDGGDDQPSDDAGADTADAVSDVVDGDSTPTDTGDVAVDTAVNDGSADAGADTDAAETAPDVPIDLGPPCVPEPTAEALLQAGASDDGVILAPGGRGLSTVGTTLEVAGYPANLVFSADQSLAYVLSASQDDRRIIVIDVAAQTIVQDINVNEAFQGIVIDTSANRLFLSGGSAQRLDEYAVSEVDGTLSFVQSATMPSYTSAMAISPDGSRLFVGSLTLTEVYEVDVAALGTESPLIVHTWDVAWPVWDLEYLPGRDELVVSSIEGNSIQFVRRGDDVVEEPVVIGQSTTDIEATADGSRVYVISSGTDELVRIDTATRAIAGRARVSGTDHVDDEGVPLGRSNPNSVAIAPDSARLFVTRGVDNAVAVIDADDLSLVGSLPTTWYPSGAFITNDGATLIINEGKGFGTGPNEGESSKDLLDGTVTIVDLATVDLEAATAQAEANFNRPNEVFPFECDGFFPIPTVRGAYTPIEHVILVVKENKTFDCVLGDLTDMDVDVDPSLVRWGEDITPNHHELARQFALSDNFYDEVEDSDMGHITLTSGYLSEYAERVWIEAQRTGQFLGFQLDAPNISPEANLFTHLLNNGVDIRIYGEIVGTSARTNEGIQPIRYSDSRYPGGPYFTLGARDADRAEYVVQQMLAGRFATFTFMLLPNDHTGGVTPGNPTPETQVADNDYGLGLLVEGVSNSEYWDSTVIIVVEDDPQGCEDHVDSHRSFAYVISPWARRGYVSHVNASYQSVFATITRILDVPPMGRPDAGAAPLWDMFTGTPDYSPYAAVPRIIPEAKILDVNTPGARESMEMDFRGPDRNEDLGTVLDAYRLWRMGRIDADEAQRRIDRGIRSRPAIGNLDGDEFEEAAEEREEEAEEELFAYDTAFREYGEWLASQGLQMPELEGGPVDPDTINAIMSGRLPVHEFIRFSP